jgi:hypothetical protein
VFDDKAAAGLQSAAAFCFAEIPPSIGALPGADI